MTLTFYEKNGDKDDEDEKNYEVPLGSGFYEAHV